MVHKRRNFIKNSGTALVGTLLGCKVFAGSSLPHHFLPAALESDDPFSLAGKHPDLIVLNDKPINAQTPAHLLNDDITPVKNLFVRNNGIPPQDINLKEWTLTIEGESANKSDSFTLEELKSKFKHYTYQLTLECGGNGRKEFSPSAKGNQWGTGAIGCPEWTGVRLKDVLTAVGLKNDAKYIGYYGKDVHLSGDPDKVVISRGVPIAKALEDESLIAWSINGEDLPLHNGYPLRLIFGGWPASTSGKWLRKIVVRNQTHDGPKMGGQSYRMPCEPVAPGSKVDDSDMCIIEQMPIKSLITSPKSGALIDYGTQLKIKGHAWCGSSLVQQVEFSIDYGSTWDECSISNAVNRHAWQHFNTAIDFPSKGYYEIWVRATDENGVAQPMVLPQWNPKGYLNNACHRIAIKVE